MLEICFIAKKKKKKEKSGGARIPVADWLQCGKQTAGGYLQ